MIEVEKDTGSYDSCQVCHSREGLYNISLSDGRFGVELHLCKACCENLEVLLHLNIMGNVSHASVDK